MKSRLAPLPSGLRAARRGLRRRNALALAGAVLALLIGAVPASAYSSRYTFLITGHGWGHGIGMSQWGAYGYAKHGWSYKAILKHYYTGISFTQSNNRTIRVRLRSGMSAPKVTCPNDYTVQGTGAAITIPGGTTATTTYVDGAYHVVAGDVVHDFGAAVTFTPTQGSMRALTTTDFGTQNGTFRGTIRVARSGSALMMINRLPLESYLRGVVPLEASASWPSAALKAQACAARAYTLRSLQSDAIWDVYCDTRDQAYGGAGSEASSTDAAVKATAGVTPSYGGSPITAYYFSCSGGHTENIEYAWVGASSVAYLKGVSDPYDSYGSLHDWGPIRRTASEIGNALGSDGTCRAVYTVQRGTSPRIVKAAIIGSNSTKYMDGSQIRVKLGLYSNWARFVSLSISPSPSDGVTITAGQKLTIKGRTYPAMANGATIKLYFSYGGTTHSRSISTSRASESLSGGYTAKYSTFSDSISPSQTTKYWFLRGSLKSAVTTITVK